MNTGDLIDDASGSLAVFALSLLWRDTEQGCCALCCTGCHALATLLGAGQLNPLLRRHMLRHNDFDWAWWGDDDGVDELWLRHAMRDTDNHPSHSTTVVTS
jgi:hypothetical protein